MFCFGLQSIARFISTRPTSTRIGWRVKENFPDTFKSRLEKIKMLFTGLGRSVLWETVPSVWVPPSPYTLGRYSRPRAQFLLIRTSQPVNNIYICYVQLTAVKKASADQCHVTVSRAQVYKSLRWPVFKVIRWPVVGFTWSQAQVHNEKAI